MDFSGLIASYRPPSAVEEDVLETLHKDQRSRQPLRRLADHIIRGMPSDCIREFIEEEKLMDCLDGPIHKGLRLIHYAVYQNEEDTVVLLLEYGASPNVMDEMGFSPVHLCAEKGYSRLIDILVSYGARIRFTEVNPEDQSFGVPPRACAADEPLRLAIRNCEHATAQLLLEHGANPSALYYLGEEINLVNPVDYRSVWKMEAFKYIEKLGVDLGIELCHEMAALRNVELGGFWDRSSVLTVSMLVVVCSRSCVVEESSTKIALV
ncbi:hypothetical protein JTE90_018891 [Oedothorax gibbosus]|uniref:Alpha-latrotoxin n=1 Tax=Oedothorax gibbosus TaxID=931172 RepID=A0AAV6UB19_9ARAC|nr:hypothetical protein JTE90_018891 [Oedothorax gibbosus]